MPSKSGRSRLSPHSLGDWIASCLHSQRLSTFRFGSRQERLPVCPRVDKPSSCSIRTSRSRRYLPTNSSGAFLNSTAQRFSSLGTAPPMIALYDLFRTADRPIYMPTSNEIQVKRIFAIIGRPVLVDDPRFLTSPVRVTNRPALIAAMSEVLRARPSAEWCRLFWANLAMMRMQRKGDCLLG